MSGPLTSNEIEDVVSSVRRLVSVDTRPRPVTRDLGQDRLMLTPALRVVADPPVAPLILTDPEPEVAPEVPEAAMAVDAEWEDEIWQEAEPPLAELALGAEEAELVGPVEHPGDDESLWAQSDVDWQEEAELAAVIPLPTAAPAADSRDHAVADAAPAEAPGSATAVQPEAEVDHDPVPTLFDKDGNPLTVLDEDALHDIVRQLIREELQGALGERITRNVRKLVRAEINRALTARALD